ncbi:hypothetical protein H5410_029543 [Solanum commersonii]|uniref:Uncharacterized protein n=1 Tax=Solanum commersonii TaxID=4109 RepID=A0A9J5YDJ4_SOLCO|nr:hypothetical protein H5410_029543 [Solanum commersonii]
MRSSIVLAIFVVNIVSTITQYEATRIFLDHHQEGRRRGVVWTRNVNMLLLPSLQWRQISPPSPNPVTSKSPSNNNSKITPSIVSQRNFINQKIVDPPPPPSKLGTRLKHEFGI